jgi:hypothetical protein
MGIKNLLSTIYKKSRVQNHSIEILPSHGQDRGPSEYFCASERKTWITFHPRNKREKREILEEIHRDGSPLARLGNARWVSRYAVMLPGRYFTDSGRLAVARHAFSLGEVHTSECVTGAIRAGVFGAIP